MSNKTKRENSSSSKQSNKEIECCSCHRKLKNERYIQCTRCINKYQCLQCFSVAFIERRNLANQTAADLAKPYHMFFHPFVIVEPPSSPPHPFTRQNWDQYEEVLLLYGIKCLGLGNWNLISEFVHTKSPIECEIHYTATYVESPNAPFPPNYKSINKFITKRDKDRDKHKDRDKQKDKDKDRSHDKEKKKLKESEKDKDYDKEKKKKLSKSTDNLVIVKKEPKTTENSKSDIPESNSFPTVKKESNSSESNSSSSSSHHHHHSHHHDGIEILPELPIPDPPAFDTRAVDSLPSLGNISHLSDKQKKEPTIPAEYSDFMPYRHEFDKDKDFEADGETLIANIEFNQQPNAETIDSFLDKVNRLKCYNKLLAERRFRTSVIEDWEVHYIEVAQPKKSHSSTANNQSSSLNNSNDSTLNPYSNRYSNYYSKLPPQLDFVDFDFKVLGGRTVEDRNVDIKLIALGPYFKKGPTTELAHLIHDRITKEYLIKTRKNWQSLGVRTLDEGQLYQALNEKIKDDKIIPSEIGDWNERIIKYNKDKNINSKNVDSELLLQCEKDLVEKLHIHCQKYLSLKNLLIREYMFHQKFPKSRMITMKNELMLPELEPIYDLCINNGWIAQ